MRSLRLIIQCKTPLHCGGGMEDNVQDQPVTRDAFGYWRIPGSSLAGALRSLAEKNDMNAAQDLFGSQQGDSSQASLVWCQDGLLLDYDNIPVLAKILSGKKAALENAAKEIFIRDHVRIDPECGSAMEGGKFDAEIVPPGARFLLEFRCDGWQKPLTKNQEDFFDFLCGLILAGNLSIGGKTTLGYGLYETIDADYRNINLATPEGMTDWLNQPCHTLTQKGERLPLPRCNPAFARESCQKETLSGWLRIPLVCDDPVIIGGGKISHLNDSEKSPDILFSLTPTLKYGKEGRLQWLPVLPASSIKGVIRHNIYRILNCLDISAERRDELLNNIFGAVKTDSAFSGKLIFTDCVLNPPKAHPYKMVQHVAIDRFSGGAIKGALFSEEPLWQPGTKGEMLIHCDNLKSHEAALLFHALLDLFAGQIGIGSGVNRGNGRLYLPDWLDNPQKALSSLSGDLAWNSVKLLANGETIKNLSRFSQIWDVALQKEAQV